MKMIFMVGHSLTHPCVRIGTVKHRNPPKNCYIPLALTWSQAGVSWRVTAWPEARFERLYGDEWIPAEPSEAALASAAQTLRPRDWTNYLDFAPTAVRRFVELFTHARMPALFVAARCPTLLPDLTETPALTLFLAAHAHLVDNGTPRWAEIAAVHERQGIYGVMQWLGLPGSRQTLSILRHVAAPDLPRKLLEPLRTTLWEPEAIWMLSHEPVLTDARLSAACHALAA